MSDWTKESLDQVKQLAPWRTNLPWWVVLIEGIVMGVVGILVLLDPQQTSVNVALFLTLVLIISGILQLWSAVRDRVTPGAESVVSARGAIAVFAGVSVWLLLYMDALSPEVGRVLFGLGSLTYGLLGFGVVFSTLGSQRRTALIESIFYTVIGLLMVYVLFAGPNAVVTATRIVGWLALLAGLALIGLSIWRWREGSKVDEAIDRAAESVHDMPETIRQPFAGEEEDAAGSSNDETWDDMQASIENLDREASVQSDPERSEQGKSTS
jgi:uncharacterized membrane protein HdeD (DUF308 family)